MFKTRSVDLGFFKLKKIVLNTQYSGSQDYRTHFSVRDCLHFIGFSAAVYLQFSETIISKTHCNCV